MSKIININDIKNLNTDVTIEIDKINALIDEDNISKALVDCENLYKKFKLNEEVNECFVFCIVSSLDKIEEYSVEKFYNYIKEIYELFNNNEYITYYVCLFYILKNKEITSYLDTSFNNDFFETVLDKFKDSDNIAHIYATSLLLNTELLDENNSENNNLIFTNTNDKFTKLMLETDDAEQISSEYGKFLYFSCNITNDKTIINKANQLLNELVKTFNENEELQILYCTFILKFNISKSETESLKTLKELDRIITNNSNPDFLELMFFMLYDFTKSKPYDECKFIIKYMSYIVNKYDVSSPKHALFISAFAESLSNYSCEENISAIKINNELLPLIKGLIDKYGANEIIIGEYCVILYNLSCLMNFYDDDDAPYIDVIEELSNCADTFDSAIPYYCLGISNLIHLNNIDFGKNVVEEIKEKVSYFDDNEMPFAKNGYSLLAIYAISIANLIYEIKEYANSLEYLFTIKQLITKNKDSSLSFDLNKDFSENEHYIIEQYFRALSYLLKKEDITDKDFEQVDTVKNEISIILNRGEF